MKRLPLLLLPLLLACPGPKPEAPPTLIIHNAKAWTGLSSGFASAVAIRGERVLAVGTDADMLRLAGTNTKLLDAGGRLLTPAYYESHSHSDAPPLKPMECLGAGFTASPATLGGPSKAEVEACVRASVAAAGPGVPLLGIVGDTYLREPNRARAFLDALAPVNPVVLVTWSGHQLSVNTAALAMGGVDPRLTPDHPWGGWERDSSGELTGVVNEYAQLQLHRRLGAQAPDSFFAGVYAAFDAEAARRGFVGVQSLPVSLSSARERQVLSTIPLKLDWETVCMPESEAEDCAGFRTVKYFRSGTPVEWRTPMYEPYGDVPAWLPPTWRGVYNLDDATLGRLITKARGQGQRFMLHVIGDEEADSTLSVLEQLGQGAGDVRFEHGYLTSDSAYERARVLGVTFVQEPLHTILKPWYVGKYGSAVAEHAHPMASLLSRGVKLAFASDTFSMPGDPRQILAVATSNPLGSPTEAVTWQQALHALTKAAAQAQGYEDRGTLEAGARADMLIHSRDFTTTEARPSPDLAKDEVLLTLKAGTPIHDTGELAPEGGW